MSNINLTSILHFPVGSTSNRCRYVYIIYNFYISCMVLYYIQAYHVEYSPLTLQAMSKPFVSVWGLACQCDYVHRCFHYPRASHRAKGTLSTKNVEMYQLHPKRAGHRFMIFCIWCHFYKFRCTSYFSFSNLLQISNKIQRSRLPQAVPYRGYSQHQNELFRFLIAEMMMWIRAESCNSCALSPCMILLSSRMNMNIYRQTSSIRRTRSQNLNVSCLVLQLSIHWTQLLSR